MDDSVSIVNEEKCIGCGVCAHFCPEDAIYENEIGAYIVDVEKCTNCGECIPVCPVDVVFQHPDLDYVIICNFCMKCVEVCNTDAIVKWEKSPRAEAKEV